MINSKKMMLLGILLSIISGKTYGWEHIIKNPTPFGVKGDAHYMSIFCKHDEFQILPFDEIKLTTGACSLTDINLKMDVDPTRINFANISSFHFTPPQKQWVDVNGFHNSWGCPSSQTWIITGPTFDNSGKMQFELMRKCGNNCVG